MSSRSDRSFEDLLGDPHEQFDARSELLASITEYAAAEPAAAPGPAGVDLTGLPAEQALALGRLTGAAIQAAEARGAERERHRQAAYLYSIIQSAENSEGGSPETDVQRAYDAGILYAARAVLENWAKDTDWTTLAGAVPDGWKYADEIRARTKPGTPLPDAERKVFDAAVEWCDARRGWFEDDPERRAEPEDLALIAAVDAFGEVGDRGE